MILYPLSPGGLCLRTDRALYRHFEEDPTAHDPDKDVEAVAVHCEQTPESRPLAPSGPLYYRVKIGPFRLPYFASPIVQLLYVAVVFFL